MNSYKIELQTHNIKIFLNIKLFLPEWTLNALRNSCDNYKFLKNRIFVTLFAPCVQTKGTKFLSQTQIF